MFSSKVYIHQISATLPRHNDFEPHFQSLYPKLSFLLAKNVNSVAVLSTAFDAIHFPVSSNLFVVPVYFVLTSLATDTALICFNSYMKVYDNISQGVIFDYCRRLA